MFRQRHFAAGLLAVAAAALSLLPGEALAGGTYRSPAARAVQSTAVTRSAETAWLLPAGAPTGRTYTYYAPPPGYQVVVEGTPSAPTTVTVVGPDGQARTTRLEGPVVTRLRYYVVSQGSR
jgi:hypothetical protein